MKKPIFNYKYQIDSIIRVDDAGLFGAKRIFEGQIKGLGYKNETIEHMYEQELEHLSYFQKEIESRKVRPTILMPIWNKLGFLLGYLTAKNSIKDAMICTEAVEEVIDKHYEDQIDYLKNISEEKKLREKIEQFQKDEIEHKEISKNYIHKKSLRDRALEFSIKLICKSAIFFSKKI
jgi:ubiquinone biosynthesis monooxygenase Coq7